MAPLASSISLVLDRSARWFLRSGIQEPNGGVARYYLSDAGRNVPISTEITGYAVSTLAWMHRRGLEGCLTSARNAGRFLADEAWSTEYSGMPFELNGADSLSYFFDCGIIARGLVAFWKETQEAEWLLCAKKLGDVMLLDFSYGSEVQPIIRLRDKLPMERDSRWSRNPGCYQLKSGLAWYELYKATGEARYLDAYERLLAWSLSHHQEFLPAASDDRRVMDRLHAYCYFLEALFPVLDRVECRRALEWGIDRVSNFLRELSPQFQRSDVCAQLLRARLAAKLLAGQPLDAARAEEEAGWTARYQIEDATATHLGGFWFGKSDGAMLPFVNPVSTAFCAQALEWWRCYQDGSLVIAPANVI